MVIFHAHYISKALDQLNSIGCRLLSADEEPRGGEAAFFRVGCGFYDVLMGFYVVLMGFNWILWYVNGI